MLYGTPTMYIDLINASKELLDQGHTLTTPEIGLCAGALCSPNLFKQIKTTFNLKRLAVIYYILDMWKKNNDLSLRLSALQRRLPGYIPFECVWPDVYL